MARDSASLAVRSASRCASVAAARAVRMTSAASASIRAASRIPARSSAARSRVDGGVRGGLGADPLGVRARGLELLGGRDAVGPRRALLGLGAPVRALDRRLGLHPHALERALGAGLALGGGALALLDALALLAQRLRGVGLREPPAHQLQVAVDLIGVVALCGPW